MSRFALTPVPERYNVRHSGVLMKHGCADEGALRRMAAALAHRGPDDLGISYGGALGLASARLSIIDLAHGRQPMVDAGLSLVANGEIYNFIELRSALEARGRRFSTGSDSETILHAYALDGLQALSSLNGMFAFAIHDTEKDELVLARDRLGIKPLYYAQLPDRFLFASEIKALLAVWPGKPELEPQALAQYLENRFNTGETGLVRGIHRLPPAPPSSSTPISRCVSIATGRPSTCGRVGSTSTRPWKNSSRSFDR